MDYRTHEIGAPENSFWFKSRQDLLTVFFGKLPPMTAGASQRSILNIGSGTGHDLQVMQQYGKLHVMDIEPRAIELIPDNLVHEKRVGDVRNISYEDNTFDVVVTCDMLEHVDNDVQAVKEILRVLKPGGYLIFTVPAFNAIYSGHDRDMLHHRRYNKSMARVLLRDFKKVELGYWFCTLFPAAAAHRLYHRNDDKQSPYVLPAILDKGVYATLKLENWLISKGVRLPFGLSLYGIYQKP